jgi:hypothetical protein
MAIVATTEPGEFLLKCLREGKAEMVAQFDRRELASMRRQRLMVAIRFVDDAAHETWLFKLDQNTVLTELDNADLGPGPVADPPKLPR